MSHDGPLFPTRREYSMLPIGIVTCSATREITIIGEKTVGTGAEALTVPGRSNRNGNCLGNFEASGPNTLRIPPQAGVKAKKEGGREEPCLQADEKELA